MINHFNDPNLNGQIEKNGFAVVPFADREQLEELRTFYHSLPEVNSKGTHVTMFHPSYEYRKKVEEKIRELFAAKAEGFLLNYRVLFTNYMIKEAGPEGNFPMHQDWTYVEEPRYSSYAFWIPLQDVDRNNGALQVVRGSHRFITALRGPYIHEPFKNLTEEIKIKYAEPVNLKAGEALVWDHRLIHFSLPNLTSQPRIAFTLIVVPKESEVIHCFGKNGSSIDEVEVYKVNPDFYLRYVISQPPSGVEKIKTVQQKHMDYSLEQFEKIYSEANSSKR